MNLVGPCYGSSTVDEPVVLVRKHLWKEVVMHHTRTSPRSRNQCNSRRWRGGSRIVCAVAATGLGIATASPASLGAPKPKIWSWGTPLGNGAAISTNWVRGFAENGRTGSQVADEVCKIIQDRALGPGDVWIVLWGWGYGSASVPGRPALPWHPLDAVVANPPIPNSELTPWMSNGIAEAGGWIDDFIQRYVFLQANPDQVPGAPSPAPPIPDPSRFHLDNETAVLPCCNANLNVDVFDAMMNDARWTSESIRGFGTQSMSDLYIAGGSLPFDKGQHAFATTDNQTWYRWIAPIASRALEGGLDEALYTPVRVQWPACKSSNYWSSTRTDGIAGRTIIGYGAADAVWLGGLNWEGLGDLQAPVMYGPNANMGFVDSNHQQGSETPWDASIRLFRHNIEACVDSFGGNHQSEVTPWVNLPAQVPGDPNDNYFSKDQSREILAMLRTKGISEFIVWNGSTGNTIANWNDMADIVDQVWASDVTSLNSISTNNDKVARIDGTTFDVQSVSQGGGGPFGGGFDESNVYVDVNTSFATPPAALNIEFAASLSVSGFSTAGYVYVFNWGTNGYDLLNFYSPNTLLTRRNFDIANAAGYIGPGGLVRLRFFHRVNVALFFPFTSKYDLIQVIGKDGAAPSTAPIGPTGDVNQDAQVNFQDLVPIITSLLVPVATVDPVLDLDGNGSIGFGDVLVVLRNWNAR